MFVIYISLGTCAREGRVFPSGLVHLRGRRRCVLGSPADEGLLKSPPVREAQKYLNVWAGTNSKSTHFLKSFQKSFVFKRFGVPQSVVIRDVLRWNSENVCF